jgi:hypothetical protein
MSVTKLLKSIRTSHLVIVAAALVLGYALYNYSENKAAVNERMENESGASGVPSHIANPPLAPGQEGSSGAACGNSYQPSAPIGENSGPASASGVSTTMQGLPPSCASQSVVNPSELLPKDENSEWAKLNPMGAGDLQNVNLLQSGYHIGINTVSSSLRNANLQLRSEPANPQVSVGPWNNTTINPDINRRPLEIGCGGKQ